MDVLTKKQRSYNMSRIRSKDTGLEKRLRKLLWSSGFRGYRLYSSLPGRPDIVFSRAKLAIFVDGCYWHGCPKCIKRAIPTNTKYWGNKIAANKKRDRKNIRALKRIGWQVIRLWEHDMKRKPQECLELIGQALRV